MGRRLLLSLLLLAAVPLAGCGAEPAAVVAVPPAPKRQVHVLPRKVLVRRAERLCRRWVGDAQALHPPGYDASDPLGSLRRVNAFARRIVVGARRGYRRLHALGVPRRGLARQRWYRFLTQYQATIDHLDEIQAGTEVLDIAYARQSLSQLRRSAASATRRGRLLGLRTCVD